MDAGPYREILQEVIPRFKKSHNYEKSYHDTQTSQCYSKVSNNWKELCRFEDFCSHYSLSIELIRTTYLQGNLRGAKREIFKGKKTLINTTNSMITILQRLN
jgi:hypothetical protein